MKKITMLFFGLFIYTVTLAQPAVEWSHTYGGSGFDGANCIQRTFDGNYIVVGESESNNGDVTGNHGAFDVWVTKLNASGNIVWQESLGSANFEYVYSIRQATDGGYIIAANTESNNSITGNHDGNNDTWIVKLSSTGSILWDKILGGPDNDYLTSVQQTTDGGYILSGSTDSNNGNVSGNHGSYDVWVVKLSNMGVIQWQKCYGGSLGDYGYEIKQTTDGGYILAGSTESNNNDVSGNHGGMDGWLVKLTNTGDIQWQKSLGGSDVDFAVRIQQTTTGGYILSGRSNSNDGQVTGNHGGSDLWVVNVNETGVIQWQKSFGSPEDDYSTSITQTIDGGFAVSGFVSGNGGDINGFHGGNDYWIIKLNNSGNIQWKKLLGGSGVDVCNHMEQTPEGGFILAGYSDSIDGDSMVDPNHLGDFWIVKLAADPLGIENIYQGSFSVYPNPSNGTFSIRPETDIMGLTHVNLFSALGKLVYNDVINIDETSIGTEIIAGDLAPGIYILQLNNGTKSYSQKLIIE